MCFSFRDKYVKQEAAGKKNKDLQVPEFQTNHMNARTESSALGASFLRTVKDVVELLAGLRIYPVLQLPEAESVCVQTYCAVCAQCMEVRGI